MNILNSQHLAPDSIQEEVAIALGHYGALKDTPIEFKFKKKLGKSIMKAQPVLGSIFKGSKRRKYVILISESFKLGDTLFYTKNLDSDILVGWFGHELGHVIDYQKRSGLNLIGFGLGYFFSQHFIKKAERTADSFAVTNGLAPYILKAKHFILNQAGISEKYRNRIKKLYLSPDEIVSLAKQLEAGKP